MIEKTLAGLVLTACVVMLLRMALGERRRHALDQRLGRLAGPWRHRLATLWRWPSARRSAQREAEETIRRAREGSWDGNVYRPRSFRGPRKPH